jgi:hypothetical protein
VLSVQYVHCLTHPKGRGDGPIGCWEHPTLYLHGGLRRHESIYHGMSRLKCLPRLRPATSLFDSRRHG